MRAEHGGRGGEQVGEAHRDNLLLQVAKDGFDVLQETGGQHHEHAGLQAAHASMHACKQVEEEEREDEPT